MRKGLFRLLFAMAAIIAITVGAGFALSSPAPAPDAVAVLKTAGMTCNSCAAKIEAALKAERGVDAVQVDVERGMVLVAFDSRATKAEDIAAKVTASGYHSAVRTQLTMEQYLAVTGGGGAAPKQAGCGGCCNKTKQ